MIYSKENIPIKDSWGNVEECQDLKYAYDLFYGKSNACPVQMSKPSKHADLRCFLMKMPQLPRVVIRKF